MFLSLYRVSTREKIQINFNNRAKTKKFKKNITLSRDIQMQNLKTLEYKINAFSMKNLQFASKFYINCINKLASINLYFFKGI